MERRYFIYGLIAVLIIANTVLLWQCDRLQTTILVLRNAAVGERGFRESDSTYLPGLFSYPGIGSHFVPHDANGKTIRAPLTLAIFFSQKTSCPAMLSEISVYRRLQEVFDSQGQSVVAVTTNTDSIAVDSLLKEEHFKIPLCVVDFGWTLEQMGISHYLTPFKVIYDSSFTAIYMRGGDNTPESQQAFEKAALRLSQLVAEKNL